MSSAIRDGDELKAAFTGAINTPLDWQKTINPCAPTRWTGVYCNKDNTNVIRLDLTNKSVGGNVAFLKLPQSLESIVLQQNQLSQDLDLVNAHLPNLKYLDIGSNLFFGQLALPLHATDLIRVNVSHNHLTSVAWDTLKMKKQLQYFIVRNNHITGPVRISEFSKRTPNVDPSLDTLDIRHNEFSGTVDFAQFQPLGGVGSILMYGNELTCCVGTWLNTYLVNTFSVGANNWRVSGKDLHDFLATAAELYGFDFEGVVAPGSTFNFSLIYEPRIHKPHYRYINLAGNGLSGNIDQWSRLWTKSLKQMNLAGNQFTGENPDLSLLDDSSDIESLRLDGNDFSGTVTWPIAWPKTLKELKMKPRSGNLRYGPNNCVDLGGQQASVITDVPICGRQETPTSVPLTQTPPPSQSTRKIHTGGIVAVVCVISLVVAVFALYYFCSERITRRRQQQVPVTEWEETEMHMFPPEDMAASPLIPQRGLQTDYDELSRN